MQECSDHMSFRWQAHIYSPKKNPLIPWWWSQISSVFASPKFCGSYKRFLPLKPKLLLFVSFSQCLLSHIAGEVYFRLFMTHRTTTEKGSGRFPHKKTNDSGFISVLFWIMCFIRTISWLLLSERLLRHTVKTKLRRGGDEMVGGNVFCSVNSSLK